MAGLVLAASVLFGTQVTQGDVFDIVKQGQASQIEAIVTADGFDATAVFEADEGEEYSLLEFAALETPNSGEVLSALMKNEETKGHGNENVLRAYHRLCDAGTKQLTDKQVSQARVSALRVLLPALGENKVDEYLPSDPLQRSLLLRCVASGTFSMVKVLVKEYNANANFQDVGGNAPLHYVLRFPDELEERMRMNNEDNEEQQSGHWRNDGHKLMSNRREMMDNVLKFATLLIEAGADGSLQNDAGQQWNGGHLERMHTVRMQQNERHARNSAEANQRQRGGPVFDEDSSDGNDGSSKEESASERRARRKAERQKRKKERRRLREMEMDDLMMDEEFAIGEDDEELDLSSISEDERREALGSRRRETAERIRRRRRNRDQRGRKRNGKNGRGKGQSFTINSQEDLKRFQSEMGDGFVSGGFGSSEDDEEYDGFDDEYAGRWDDEDYERRREQREREREERRREMDDRMESVRQRHEEMRARHEAEREERRRKRREKYGDDWDPSKLREQLQQEREERRRELDARMKQREQEREERRRQREERRRQRRKKRDL